MPTRTSARERFAAKFERRGPDDCWPWRAYRGRQGYGQFRLDGAMRLAHRVAWELAHGRKVPPGKQVLHTCDTPPCVNPHHLFLGTNTINVADKMSKRRHRSRQLPGETSPNAKLTEAQVREVLRSPETGAALAMRFGVSKSTISFIRRNRRWKHVRRYA